MYQKPQTGGRKTESIAAMVTIVNSNSLSNVKVKVNPDS